MPTIPLTTRIARAKAVPGRVRQWTSQPIYTTRGVPVGFFVSYSAVVLVAVLAIVHPR